MSLGAIYKVMINMASIYFVFLGGIWPSLVKPKFNASLFTLNNVVLCQLEVLVMVFICAFGKEASVIKPNNEERLEIYFQVGMVSKLMLFP